MMNRVQHGAEPVGVKRFDKFKELPITSITPQGWLRTFLENQRQGLTGHLDAAAGNPFNTGDWLSSFIHTVETAYWYDGMIRCGYLLQDEFLIQRVKKEIESVLANPAKNGNLGQANWVRPKGHRREPHRTFFRAMMAEYSVTGDECIVQAMHKHYLATTPDQHCDDMDTGNIEQLCWLYGQTADKRLLDHALKAYELFNGPKVKDDSSWAAGLEYLLSDKQGWGQHGVRFMEHVKLPAILYTYTGDRRLLEAAINGLRKLDRDHMLIDGCPSSQERLTGRNPRACHETCVITDFSYTIGYMLLITGAVEWADKIERVCFNAGIGAVTKDFKALQYHSSPNQVLATSYSNHCLELPGRPDMSYRPAFVPYCCSANVNRFMPNYAARMWLCDRNGGLVAALYGPSLVRAELGKDKQPVTIIEKTDYPFSEQIQFEIQAQNKVRFALWMRIPGWCQQAVISVNDKPTTVETQPGSFVKLEREFAPNDIVTLSLPMKLKLNHWLQPAGSGQRGISVERGPLVYSLLIKEDRKVDKDVEQSSQEFPAWNILPASPWNYALDIDESQLEKDVEIIRLPMGANPWQVGASPIQLRVPARRVPGWTLDRDRYTPNLPSPVDAGPEVERITLVPLGSTCLRLTIFPDCRWNEFDYVQSVHD